MGLRPQVEERLRNRKFLTAAEISKILDDTRNRLCRQLCAGETCDRCRVHKNGTCRLTPVLSAIRNLDKEILEELSMEKQQPQIPRECPECSGKNLVITNVMPLSDEQDNVLLRLSFRCCICNHGWSEMYRLERCTDESP